MDDHGDEFVEYAEGITSRIEFIEFTQRLLNNFRNHPEEWDNDTLANFLEGLAGFVRSMDGYYRNCAPDVDCDVPTWRVFADILLAARVYE
jgi:hypothetical protein